MITEKDLQEAIAEVQGKRTPSANDCIKLAAFYTIRNELFGNPGQITPSAYSFAAPSVNNTEKTIDYDSGSEFSQVINGRRAGDVWAALDSCMSELKALQPKLYYGILDEIEK